MGGTGKLGEGNSRVPFSDAPECRLTCVLLHNLIWRGHDCNALNNFYGIIYSVKMTGAFSAFAKTLVVVFHHMLFNFEQDLQSSV